MRFLDRRRDEANLIGISMGEQGIISRVLGLRAGSVFTFAVVFAGRGDRRRPDRRAHSQRNLAHRPDRSVNQGLRRRRQSRPPLALAAHPQHGLPPRDRQRRLPAAANLAPQRSAHPHARSSAPRPRHHHAVQDGNPEAPGPEPTRSPQKIGAVQHGRSRAGWQALRLQHRCRRRHSPARTPPASARR